MNKKLNQAIKNKNDEFYTRIEDIELELENYKHHFNDKIIYLNCDNPNNSHFFKYFYNNFSRFNLKKLICTFYEPNKMTFKTEVFKTLDSKGNPSIKTIQKIFNHNGDFRHKDCIDILKYSDIIVTNPPYSLFREYLDIIMENNKSFVIIGNCNAISYKNCFNYIKTRQVWIGYHCVRKFFNPKNELVEAARSFWFTNLEINKEYPINKTCYQYDSNHYPEYDNYHAIEVKYSKKIPNDYSGFMGLPLTSLLHLNMNNYEIFHQNDIEKKNNWHGKFDRPYLNNKKMYFRIFLKKINY